MGIGGLLEAHQAKTPEDAMKRAEWVALLQLASLGVRSARIRRQDGTKHMLEVPHGTY